MKAETKMIVAAAVVAALCLTAVTSVTQSWFSDEEHATVDVTTGKVDIKAEAGEISLYSLGLEVSDRFTNGGTAALGYSAADGITVTASDMTPGDRFDFLMSVYNLSTVSTLYRMVCTVSGENSSEFSISVGGAVITGYFSTEWALQAATDGGEHLIEAVAVSVELPAEATQSATLSMTLRAEAVQSNASTDIVGISNAAELRAFAAEVNCGNTCEGKTVKLLADIDLENDDWTPIGTSTYSFKGTFDGNGKTISNLNISAGDRAGFFANFSGPSATSLNFDHASVIGRESVAVFAAVSSPTSTISEISVDHSTVVGGHWVGSIVGYTYGVIEKCQVSNSSLSAAPYLVGASYDNGDKVGGIVGFKSNGGVYECSVKDTTVKGYRDIGGVVGIAVKDNYDPVISKNSVENLTIIQSSEKGYGSSICFGTIVGRDSGCVVEDSTISGYLKASVDEGEINRLICSTSSNPAGFDTIEVDLKGNASIDVSDAYIKFGGPNTSKVTISGSEGSETLRLSTTYWSRVSMANLNAVLTMNNLHVTSDQESGTWDSYDITFWECNVSLKDICFEKAVALNNSGFTSVLKNVSINESHDYYALWIVAGGDVTIDGLKVNSEGRAIKISDQYVTEPEKTTLSVSNSTFVSKSKSAVIVGSKAGADITWGSGNDISNVSADIVNAVWVDEDWKDYDDLVTVTGCSKKIEGA